MIDIILGCIIALCLYKRSFSFGLIICGIIVTIDLLLEHYLDIPTNQKIMKELQEIRKDIQGKYIFEFDMEEENKEIGNIGETMKL